LQADRVWTPPQRLFPLRTPQAPSLRLMRLRVSNPALIPDLLEFLRSRVDVVAGRRSTGVEVELVE
jgi:hypothetical protein